MRTLTVRPDVLLVHASGADHPRRAGLALHLGRRARDPRVGVTHRPLGAAEDWPADEAAAISPLLVDGALVGFWVRTGVGRRPLAVHAGWRTDAPTAARIVPAAARVRTPEPLRQASRLARTARADQQIPKPEDAGEGRRGTDYAAHGFEPRIEDRRDHIAMAGSAGSRGRARNGRDTS